MRLKLDENMPADLAAWLREQGQDVETVADEGMAGSVDERLLEAATAEGRVLVTFDLGFGDLRVYPPGTHGGIIVLRLRDHRWAALLPRVETALGQLDPEHLRGSLTVVDEVRVRHRAQ